MSLRRNGTFSRRLGRSPFGTASSVEANGVIEIFLEVRRRRRLAGEKFLARLQVTDKIILCKFNERDRNGNEERVHGALAVQDADTP